MITLEDDHLVFRFPEVHQHATCSIDLQRTLRIPDDGKRHLLPPGLGSFPLRHLDDYANRLPRKWRDRGGVIMPMHQAEALWLNFDTHAGEFDVEYPFAIKVATGKVDAVTGDPWSAHLAHVLLVRSRPLAQCIDLCLEAPGGVNGTRSRLAHVRGAKRLPILLLADSRLKVLWPGPTEVPVCRTTAPGYVSLEGHGIETT